MSSFIELYGVAAHTQLLQILGNMDGLEVLPPFKNLAHLELSTFTGRVYIPPLVSLFMNAPFVECLHIKLVPDHNTHKNVGTICSHLMINDCSCSVGLWTEFCPMMII